MKYTCTYQRDVDGVSACVVEDVFPFVLRRRLLHVAVHRHSPRVTTCHGHLRRRGGSSQCTATSQWQAIVERSNEHADNTEISTEINLTA